ncbi:MAG: DNA repair protein RadA [Limnochordia bacterium]|jgi:DNA repair protein RadA/Sms|nr:DNA repair protein RadA [Limnochordia bacterium]MDD2629177.1 DNA repair protein RadA [Limnochordia bacterium]
MGKSKGVRYVCQACGYESLGWMGRCSSCGQWDSLVQQKEEHPQKSRIVCQTVPITRVAKDQRQKLSLGIDELDRVVGGGLLPGAVVLVGGQPGIGKSTLLLQAAASVAKGGPVVYVSGEESAEQIYHRAVRLNARVDNLLVLTATDVLGIIEELGDSDPLLVIIDSIQTMHHAEASGYPGSVGQVQKTANALIAWAKTANVPLIIVGHITKSGSLAGPKVLEHAVDCVLYFDGEAHTNFRILRAVKNRFGSTNEVGVFEMKQEGLKTVLNPSCIFLAERPLGVAGSVVAPSMEGSRSLLVELQALVAPSLYGGTPRRLATGLNYNRASIVLAVLEKRQGFKLANYDVYLNVAGGLRVEEPAMDLAIAVAVTSSLNDIPVNPDIVIIGEVGLTGEVRPVGHIERRLQESTDLGFRRCVLPAANHKELNPGRWDIEMRPASTLKEALKAAFSE